MFLTDNLWLTETSGFLGGVTELQLVFLEFFLDNVVNTPQF